MIVYLVNYLLMFLWSFLKNRNFVILIIGIQLFLILALRSDTLGVDLDNYQEAYSYYQNFSFVEILKSLRFFGYADLPIGAESGFVLVNWLLSSLGLSFHSFLVIHSFACVLLLSLFVLRYSKIPWLSFSIFIAIGMYSYMFCILRQTIAVVILYQTIRFIRERDIAKFLLLVFIASSFHIVAILFLPLYWLGNLKLEYKNFCIGILISAIVSILVPFIYSIFLAKFFMEIEKGYNLESSFQYNNMFIFMLVIITFIFTFFKDDLQKSKSDTILMWGAFMAIPVQTMSFFIPIFSRAAIGIFLPLIAVLIPNVIAKNKDFSDKIFPKLLVYCVFLLYFLFTFSNGGLQIIPYRLY